MKSLLIITGNYMSDIFIENLVIKFLNVNKTFEFDILQLQWKDNQKYCIDKLSINCNKIIYKSLIYEDFLKENNELINYYESKKGFRLSMLIQAYQWKKSLELIDIDNYECVIRMRDDLIFMKETKIDDHIIEYIKKDVLFYPNKNSFIKYTKLPGHTDKENGICDFMAISNANIMRIYLNLLDYFKNKDVTNYRNQMHFEHNLIKHLKNHKIIRNDYEFNCTLQKFLR